MKKIINQPETVVAEMCSGIAAAHPELALVEKYKILKKREIDKQKVTLISGGGSGHEPAHAGFIGEGMLDAAVCGDVFASPSQIQVYKAIKETASEKGTLLIIKNYSGDMMNFKNAAHLAAEDGLTVDYVKVDDDIAVKDSLYTVGRRGVAGTVFVHKTAGAAAAAGLELEEVKRIAEKAARNVKSIGFALTSCTVPAKGSPTFELGADEMEYGVGIHGEPGISREPILTADELAKRMVDALVDELEFSGREEAAVLVNGFGGTPLQELYLLNNSVIRELSARGVKAVRIYVGNYMTSIDMEGASISLLKLDAELKKYLTAPALTPAFKVIGTEADCTYIPPEQQPEAPAESSQAAGLSGSSRINGERLTTENIIYLVDRMSQVIIENEVPFCELDSFAGDGDFGMSVAKGFRELKKEWQPLMDHASDNIGQFLEECSLIIMEYCGGASGPIWGSAFRNAGKAAGNKAAVSKAEFAAILEAAVKGIQDTGERSFGRGAVVGDKTLIDALVPCADAWEQNRENPLTLKELFVLGAEEAVAGAKRTEAIAARMGRAGTVGERSIGHPDAGAHALGVIFTALAESIQ